MRQIHIIPLFSSLIPFLFCPMPFGFLHYLDDGIAAPSFLSAFLLHFAYFCYQFFGNSRCTFVHALIILLPPVAHARVQTSFEIKTFSAVGARWRNGERQNRILDYVFQLAHQLANKTL